jgi:putative MATE family efflux protein
MINPIATLVLCLLNAIAAGGTVIVAQYKGRGIEDKINEAAGHTLCITIGLAIAICALLILFASPIVTLLYGHADPLVVSKAHEYLSGVSVSLVIYSVYSAVFAIFRGLGENKICLNLTLYINVSYFIFSYILINILKLDIYGTIWALILARLLGSFVSIYHLFLSKKRMLHLKAKEIFTFHMQVFQSMLKISIPFGSEQLFFYGGTILVQKYMVDLGTASIAANAIASSLFALAYFAPIAVGNLATTVIGQCMGAGKKDLVRWYGKKLIVLSTFLTLISIAIFIPLIPWLTSLFHPEPETIPLIRKLLLIAIVPMPFFWPMSNVMPYTLRSAGDATYSSIVSLVTMWVIRVGAGYIAAIPLGYGIEGVWVCMSLEWVVRTVLFFIRYKDDKWLNKKTI